MQRTPLACFCTTTNVQDKKFVSLEDYVDLRKITAKKVLEAIINKNYNNLFQFSLTKRPQLTQVLLQDHVALLRLLV